MHTYEVLVIGGGINGCGIAAEAANKLAAHFPQCSPAWTHQAPLPGGDLARANVSNLDELNALIQQQFPWLPEPLRQRYLAQYGVRTWAISDEGILWRRTKLGITQPLK